MYRPETHPSNRIKKDKSYWRRNVDGLVVPTKCYFYERGNIQFKIIGSPDSPPSEDLINVMEKLTRLVYQQMGVPITNDTD